MPNLHINCCLKLDFQKSELTKKGQVVYSQHQTPQGQSMAKPETPLLKIQVENTNLA